jgi:hypothetical protein
MNSRRPHFAQFLCKIYGNSERGSAKSEYWRWKESIFCQQSIQIRPPHVNADDVGQASHTHTHFLSPFPLSHTHTQTNSHTHYVSHTWILLAHNTHTIALHTHTSAQHTHTHTNIRQTHTHTRRTNTNAANTQAAMRQRTHTKDPTHSHTCNRRTHTLTEAAHTHRLTSPLTNTHTNNRSPCCAMAHAHTLSANSLTQTLTHSQFAISRVLWKMNEGALKKVHGVFLLI